MINANELRIGNLLMFTKLKENTELQMEGHHIASAGTDIKWLNYFFEPITLTEKWLLKFGFVIDGSNYFFDFIDEDNINRTMAIETTIGIDDIGTIEIGILSTKFDQGGAIDDTMNYCKLKHIKYVHQLQNLYFSLTGEELHP